TLNKAQANPVSFDYEASGGSIGASGNGTVTWATGETGSKTFTVNVAEKGSDELNLWQGQRAFVIGVSNVKNAVFDGNATSWSKTVSVSANDSLNRWVKIIEFSASDATVKANFPGQTRTVGGKNHREDVYDSIYYEIQKKVNWVPSKAPIRFTVNYSKDVSDVQFTGNIVQYTGLQFKSMTSCTPVVTLYLPTGASLTGNETAKAFKLELSSDKKSASVELSSADTDFTSVMQNGETWLTTRLSCNYLYYLDEWFFWGHEVPLARNNNDFHYPTVESITLEAQLLAKVTDVSVSAGTYYSGQVVPVTVTFDHYCTARQAAKLLVNNEECPILESDDTISKKFTFAYTVKSVDTGSVNVTGIQNMDGMDTGTNFPQKSFGVDEGVKLVSDVKRASLDLANVRYGITEEIGTQVMTVLIPFKDGANKEWIASENEDFAMTTGQSISLPLPDMPNATTTNYLRGAYFSYDNGKTRYPVYIVNNNGEEGVALAVRLSAPLNTVPYLRKDTINLFMDMTVGIDSAETYLDTWENAQTDAQGFVYFDGTGKAGSAPVLVGADYSAYVLGSVLYEPEEFTTRGEIDYTDKVDTENGFLNLDDGNHVYLQDTEHPENQYDVEIIANDAFYKGIINGIRAEDSDELTLSYNYSNRKNFTFKAPKYFTWTSSDTSIAEIVMDENGVGHVVMTGKEGAVTFTLTVGNGSPSKAYDLKAISLNVLEGKTPFLNISEYSQKRQTLTYTDTDVPFASNVTARNAQLDKTTIFT
ncbi:MAG: hypothetical protein VZR73_12465, partial [Acutalibacteraceae bacterium]|nr:hypothetical protein [Acutalibacteraceae bacterium]